MELEDLLRRASAAPLGPLAFTFTPLSASEWALTVTRGGKSHPIQAERDVATDGLILTSALDGAAPTATGQWVTEVTKASDGHTVRLWLHGDGLSSAMLLNALAALVPPAPLGSMPADDTEVELPTISIPLPAPPDRPPPVPVERPRPVGWNSFGRRESPEQEPASASTTAVPSSAGQPDAASHGSESATESAIDAPSTEAAAVDGSVAGETAPTATAGESTPIHEAPLPEDEAPEAAGAAGICRECGSPYEPDHAFCTNCGARLSQGGE